MAKSIKDGEFSIALKPIQTRRHSIIEQLVHTAVGFAITLVCIYLFFPEIPFITNIKATALMTLVKFVTHFGIRRAFTHHTYHTNRKTDE